MRVMEKVGGDERVITFITINFRLNLIIEISLFHATRTKLGDFLASLIAYR